MRKIVILIIVFFVSGAILLLYINSKSSNRSNKQVGQSYSATTTNVTRPFKNKITSLAGETMFLKQVSVNSGKALIEIDLELLKKSISGDINLNPLFKGNAINLSKNLVLSDLRPNPGSKIIENNIQKEYAYIMSYPKSKYSNSQQYGALYVQKIEDDKISFVQFYGHCTDAICNWANAVPSSVTSHFSR